MPKAKNPPKPQLPAVLTKHQSYVYKEIPRSLITGADYNPRRISDQNRKMLKEALKRKGLVEPPVWNVRTGNLVGGHQRISILDDLEGSPNYLIGVSQVDLTEQEERELNISLNSPNLQGHYDADMFFDVLKTPHLDLDAIGFTPRDITLEFADVPADIMALFAVPEAPSPLVNPAIPSDIQSQMDELDQGRKEAKADGSSKPDRNSLEALKDRKDEYKQSDSSNPVHDTDYSLQILFNSQTDREAFLAHNNLRSLSRFVTADEMIPLLSPAAKWRKEV